MAFSRTSIGQAFISLAFSRASDGPPFWLNDSMLSSRFAQLVPWTNGVFKRWSNKNQLRWAYVRLIYVC